MKNQLFKQQLRAFTEQNKQTQKNLESRLQKLQLDQIEKQYAYIQQQLQPEQAQEPQNLSDLEKAQNAQNNINAFLKTAEAYRKRDIATELKNGLTMMRDETTLHASVQDPFYTQTQSKIREQQLEQERQSQILQLQVMQQQDLELNQIITEEQNMQLVDTQLIYKNEKLTKFTYLLASYLDLKHSCLYGEHYSVCIRLCREVLAAVAGPQFIEYVNRSIIGCSSENVYQRLLGLGPDEVVFQKLLSYFKAAFRQGDVFKNLKQPLKKQSSFLQQGCGQNAYEQFFVTAAFGKLAGGVFEEDNAQMFPIFVC